MSNRKKRDFDLSTISGRLAMIIDEQPNIREFADKVGVLTSYLTRVLNNSETTLTRATSIAEAAGYSMNWISWGIEPKLLSDFINSPFDSTCINIPPLDENQKIDIDFDPQFIEANLKAVPANCRAWLVTDDNMAGIYGKGDTVLVELKNTTGTGTFVVSINGAYTIRKISHPMNNVVKLFSSQDGETVINNEAFESLDVIGRIVWSGGRA